MSLTVNTNSDHFINCDFTDTHHCTRLCELVNEYISDPKGGGEILSDRKKLYMLDGLESNPYTIVMFALYKEKIIGYTVAFLNFSTFLAAPSINIHDFFIVSEYRGKGKGKEMLRKINDIANDLKCKKITLEVRKDNEVAQILYFNEGYSPTSPKMLFWVKYL